MEGQVKRSRMLVVLAGLLVWLALDPALSVHRATSASESPKSKLMQPPQANSAKDYFWSPGAMSRLLQRQPLEPIASPRKYRSGPGTFRTLAPAVVVVRSWHGHGSGLVIDAKGLILTNNHVVEGNTYVDPKG